MPPQPPAVVVMSKDRLGDVLPPELWTALEAEVTLIGPPMEAEDFLGSLESLHDLEILVTGWGGALLTESVLEALPKLRLVVVASGSIKHVAGPRFWERRIPIVSAASVNAIPVVEFSVAQIVLGLKQTYRMARQVRRTGSTERSVVGGTYGANVGLVSLGEIGQGVLRALQQFNVNVNVYDPYAQPIPGVSLVDLPTMFATSQVVSVHTPLLPQTVGLIDRALLEVLPEGATLLNTSRGPIIDEDALIGVFKRRPDLTAVLDVTVDDPVPDGSALRELENIVLTGHIAGSLGRERARLGALAVSEVSRFNRGLTLKHEVDPITAAIRA